MTTRAAGTTLDEIEAIFAPLSGRRILDIGCGPGRLVEALTRKGAIVTGVDPEPEVVTFSAPYFGYPFARWHDSTRAAQFITPQLTAQHIHRRATEKTSNE